jgi:aminopeptidase N
MKQFFTTAAPLLFFCHASMAQYPADPRSDSLDITSQKISLTITDFTGRTVSGYSELKLGAKTSGVKGLYLDLLRFAVDSVTIQGLTLPFSYNDTLLKVTFPTSLQQSDTITAKIWYHGEARQGTGGWGGFYWNQGIAFNMGVTLYDIPHGAGRFWFPCFDQFTEKALYEVEITTLSNHTAVCGGILTSETDNGNGTKTWYWRLNQPVPSYLVSVAVGPYAFVHKTFNGANGPVPVILAGLPSDTVAMKNSFQNLESAFHIYEDLFGSYLWDRIGYVLVPFNGGAMEHAANVAYQRTLIDGNTTYEAVMAHELSHNWWGNLVTCETAEDMWINEGMAVFCESLFREFHYGRANALAGLRTDLSSVIRTAHTEDDGYHPLSGVPQEHTYGKHSYDKGGLAAWSLRGYMGDSLFFRGLKSVLKARRFGNVNAWEFRDILTDSTGFDAGPFFDGWIFQPGFAEFLIDSVRIEPQGNSYLATVITSQRLRAANQYYQQVPLEVSFVGPNRQEHKVTHWHSGSTTTTTHNIPFLPAFSALNRNEKLMYAVTALEKEIKTTGNSSFTYANFRINTQTVSDSALVRAEYHWAAPDQNLAEPWKYEITPDRFWRIGGIFPAGFNTNGVFLYDGSAAGPDQIIYSEDSVLLFYRRNAFELWKPAENTVLNKQTANDKKGNVTANNLEPGEYCIGTKRAVLNFDELPQAPEISIFPNPTRNHFTINGLKSRVPFTMSDMQGRTVVSGKTDESGQAEFGNLVSGPYLVRISNEEGKTKTGILIVKH